MRVTGVGDRLGAQEMLAEPLTHSWPFRLNRELAPCPPHSHAICTLRGWSSGHSAWGPEWVVSTLVPLCHAGDVAKGSGLSKACGVRTRHQGAARPLGWAGFGSEGGAGSAGQGSSSPRGGIPQRKPGSQAAAFPEGGHGKRFQAGHQALQVGPHTVLGNPPWAALVTLRTVGTAGRVQIQPLQGAHALAGVYLPGTRLPRGTVPFTRARQTTACRTPRVRFPSAAGSLLRPLSVVTVATTHSFLPPFPASSPAVPSSWSHHLQLRQDGLPQTWPTKPLQVRAPLLVVTSPLPPRTGFPHPNPHPCRPAPLSL